MRRPPTATRRRLRRASSCSMRPARVPRLALQRITATVYDAAGNPLAGVPVTLAGRPDPFTSAARHGHRCAWPPVRSSGCVVATQWRLDGTVGRCAIGPRVHRLAGSPNSRRAYSSDVSRLPIISRWPLRYAAADMIFPPGGRPRGPRARREHADGESAVRTHDRSRVTHAGAGDRPASRCEAARRRDSCTPSARDYRRAPASRWSRRRRDPSG